METCGGGGERGSMSQSVRPSFGRATDEGRLPCRSKRARAGRGGDEEVSERPLQRSLPRSTPSTLVRAPGEERPPAQRRDEPPPFPRRSRRARRRARVWVGRGAPTHSGSPSGVVGPDSRGAGGRMAARAASLAETAPSCSPPRPPARAHAFWVLTSRSSKQQALSLSPHLRRALALWSLAARPLIDQQYLRGNRS